MQPEDQSGHTTNQTLLATIQQLQNENIEMRRRIEDMEARVPRTEDVHTSHTHYTAESSKQRDNHEREVKCGIQTTRGMTLHPFAEDIIREQLPKSFQIPNIDGYDGKTNLEEHLTLFNTRMILVGATDALYIM